MWCYKQELYIESNSIEFIHFHQSWDGAYGLCQRTITLEMKLKWQIGMTYELQTNKFFVRAQGLYNS
jgi:hypothetical protein